MSLNQSFISDFSEYSRWSQRTKIKYKLHYGWCWEMFYGRHTAQRQLQWFKKIHIIFSELWLVWKFGQPFNKQNMMAIYWERQAVGGIVFYKHQL